MSRSIAVLAERFLGWTGGRIYLQNLVAAAASQFPRRRIVGIAPGGSAGAEVLSDADEVVSYPVRGGLRARAARSARDRLSLGESLPSAALRRVAPGAIFGNGLSTRWGSAVLVANMLDYQDRFYPQLITPERLRAREAQEARVAHVSDGIVFNSHATLEDFTARHPASRAVMGVVPLLAAVSERDMLREPDAVAEKYALPRRFVIVPSQLWEHKNHMQLVAAALTLEKRNVDLGLVLAGSPYDPRRPRYASQLLQAVSAGGLRDRIVVLGELDRDELVALMRQSVGFVQPSLHEGGGLPAEEARILGKRIVLADLPLQREQDVAGACYFEPGDAESLADAIERAFSDVAPGVDREAEGRALAASARRSRAAGAEFLRLIEAAVERRGARRARPRGEKAREGARS